MEKLTDINDAGRIKENQILFQGTGSSIKLNHSQIIFKGKNNILCLEDNINLNHSVLEFNGDNSIVYLSENKHHTYTISVSIFHNSVFYMGRNNYFNGLLHCILSEERNILIGDNCLFSFGVWIRVADPHLIYDGSSGMRINNSRSVFIGDHVWIGQSAILLKGTTIGSGSVVGAGSIVTGTLKSNAIYAGNRAQLIKENIFWDESCVHSWTEEQAQRNARYQKKDSFQYTESYSTCGWPEIESYIRNKQPEEKIEIIKNIIKDQREHNRFAIGSAFPVPKEENRNFSGGGVKRLFVWHRNWEALCAQDYRADRSIGTAELEDGIILPTKYIGNANFAGGVCDSEFHFVAGFLRNGRENLINPGYYGCAAAYPVKESSLSISKETVIFGGVLVGHFGHFILEGLSRLWYHVKYPNLKYKIAFVTILGYKEWFADFLHLLEIPENRILLIESPTKFSKVIIPEESVHSWKEYLDEYLLPYDKIRKSCNRGTYKKIYLTRREFERDTGKHECDGEEYFEDFYKKKGYEVIAPESLSIRQQIEVIAGAEEIVTTLGSISHLVLFAERGTKVVLLNRVDDDTLLPQCLINQAAGLDWCFVDVSANFLFSNRAFGVNQLGITKYWREFVKDRYNETIYEQDTLKTACYQYLVNWCKYYIKPENYNKIKNHSLFDSLNKMSRILLDQVLDSADYEEKN